MPEPEERKALTMERVVERLGRTTAFVGRMMKAGECVHCRNRRCLRRPRSNGRRWSSNGAGRL